MKRYIAGSKDSTGSYTSPEPQPKDGASVSIDSILSKQLLALERVTKQLVTSSSGGAMTRDEIQSLATCIKVTLELKEKEKELLADLSDDELEEISK